MSHLKSGVLSFFARWFFLWLSGIWIYIVGQSLRLTVSLGAPFYDWQWYIPLILVVFILFFGLSRPQLFDRLPYKKHIFGSLLIWLLVGFNGFGYEEHFSLQDVPPLKLSFWGPRISNPLPEALLADLQSAQATLIIRPPLPLTEENRTSLKIFLQQLEAYDIQAILFIPASDFLSAPVYREWLSSSEEVIAFLEYDSSKNLRGLIGDAEGPRFTPFESFADSRSSVDEAAEELNQFLQRQQQVNPQIPIGVTASWPLYLDKLDGDNDLALLYQSPVDPPGNWGFISIMNYSSYYPESWRAYLVARTIWGMDRRFPDTAPIHLIGLAGKGFAWEPVLDFEGVVQDARISRALGVAEVVVFHLKGAIDIHGEDFVARLHTAVNGPASEKMITIPFSRPASIWLFGYTVVDAALDLRLKRFWFSLGWLAVSFIICLKIRSNR